MTTRERGPRPGVTWQQQPTRREVVVPDGPWGGPATVRAWTDPSGTVAAWQPAPPANREQRRAEERARRKKGNTR